MDNENLNQFTPQPDAQPQDSIQPAPAPQEGIGTQSSFSQPEAPKPQDSFNPIPAPAPQDNFGGQSGFSQPQNSFNQQGAFSQGGYAQGGYQQPYQQPAFQQPYQGPVGEQPVSIGDWMLTMLLSFIPCVNLIMLFVWGFGSGAPKSKSNWAKAVLIWTAIIVVIYLVIGILFGAAIIAALQDMAYYY